MKTLLLALTLLSSLSAFAVDENSTLGKIFGSGYQIQVEVVREMGIVIPSGGGPTLICPESSLIYAIRPVEYKEVDRIVKKGRTFTMYKIEEREASFLIHDSKNTIYSVEGKLGGTALKHIIFKNVQAGCSNDLKLSIIPRLDLEEASIQKDFPDNV